MLRPTAGAVLVAVAALLGPALASGQGPGATRPVFEHVHALTFDAEGRAFWLGTHASALSAEIFTVAFMGSMVAWARNGVL